MMVSAALSEMILSPLDTHTSHTGISCPPADVFVFVVLRVVSSFNVVIVKSFIYLLLSDIVAWF